MEISLDNREMILIATPEGDDSLDSTNFTALKEKILTDLSRESDLVVDLSSIRFIDSSGVGALISLLKAVRRGGRRLVLSGITPPVLSILEVIRLTAIFEIDESVDAAVARLETGGRPSDGDLRDR